LYTVESWVNLMSRHQIGRLTKGASAVALATFALQVMIALPAGAANVAGAATTARGAKATAMVHSASPGHSAGHAATAGRGHRASPAFGGTTGPDSGTDASCPATTPAAAGSSTVTAPTQVRAIGGDGSATVVWCPPASGAGSVVSYTITSSGGQQTTADVPNLWTIVDGLTDGTRYTFTVTANTAGGQASSGATSAPVTPATLPPPRDVLHGQPQQVTYDQYSLTIGGQRVYITAGEFDPWRTPSPSLWLDDLQKMKADGYNAVTVYFNWDYSSPSPGVYDFSGVRDMNLFLNMAQQVGLYVIARPGPYINAETDAGGIAAWALPAPNGYRTDAEPFESAGLQWLSEIDSIIAPHQITKGGDVIAYQIENEYTGRSTADLQYLANLEAQAKSDGIDVPFTFNQCCGGPFYTSGTGAVNISGPDNYPLGFNCSDTSNFGQPYSYPTQPGEPLYLPEFQGGSFDGWGGSGYDNCYTMTGADFENVYYKNNIAQGATMQSYYMGVGGTNWGWLPAPQVYTSYDYGAGIRETGEIGTPANPNDITGSKFGENKLINDFETSVAPLTKTTTVGAPATDNAAVAAMARANPDDGTQFVYLRQADATSTATVSTHMALNADQAAGYTYDDTDPALVYTGDWTHAGPSSGYTSGDYDSTESWSTETGDSMTVTFTGTAVQWIGPKNTNGGIADVYIDGNQVATVDTYSPAGKLFQQVLYSTTGLSAGSHTLTITVSGQKNPASSADTVVVDAIDVPTAAQQADYYPVVPQQGSITLQGREADMLLANYSFDGEQLMYSTSQLMTHQDIGGTAVALLYGDAGTDGETVLRYSSQPTVNVLAGSVQSTWDPARGDLRLDYTHQGLAEVQISGGGTSPLLLLIADTNTAESFWPESTSAGPVLVSGGYLVRTAASYGRVLALTGDTSQAGPLTVWAPPGIKDVTWNGQPVNVTTGADGSLHGSVPGPGQVSLPSLTNWRFSYETPETQPGFDDSSWTLADHPVTTNGTSANTPALYASDYGYDHGFTWYRGHFTATGTETGVTLTADGISPTGAFSVWLNGAFLGSHSAAGPQRATFSFPPGAINAGQDNVIAVLVENTGNPEGPSGEKTGLYSATLDGSPAPVTWRMMGSPGGSTLQDPVRGVMNATGLFGTGNGWDLPGYPDQNWQQVTLPDNWSARGVPPGVGWYRTQFDLNLPQRGYVPIAVQIGGPGPGAGTADYRAFIFVNGWLIGRYINNVGPQHQFYVPAGILNDRGPNTLAIAVWGMDATSGGLDQVSLVAEGNQAGGVPVFPVDSPGYNPQQYGPPAAPQPTLAAIPSTALAQGTFTVKATLTNPTFRPLTGASVSLAPPSSAWTVTPSGPASLGTVAPGASASATFTVTAPSSGLTPGLTGLLATATFRGGFGQTQTLVNTAQVNVPAPNLAATFDNTGTTDNSNTNPSPGFEGFDGIGTTYSAQGLATAGLTPGGSVSAGGLSFTWPNEPSAEPNNTMAEGQTIAISGSGSNLGFLAAANNSAESGTGLIYYTDGSTQPFTLNVGNFWYPQDQDGNPPNTQVASVNYANYPTGSSGHTVYVFEESVPIDPSKTVAAVTLPSLGDVAGYNPALHIFAMSIG
jgi:beta-galactosidase GanA